MGEFKLETPVLFLVFNRPDTTAQVFEAIKQAKPPRLYVASDGAREDKEGELEKVKQVREIVSQVDWNCEVKTLFRDKNLGCKIAVSSAIDWLFEQEEMGIILEDDCLPHPTFFRFCQELLERYRDDERIGMISGNNFQFGRKCTDYSYYFSMYSHIWGWASWRRAWKYYDVDMKIWPEIRDDKLLYSCIGGKGFNYWKNIFERVYQGEINTWDYQWTFTCWVQNKLSILPRVNLVSNIGFGAESTHAKDINSPVANMPTEAMDFPLKHPDFIIRNVSADNFTQQNIFGSNIKTRIKTRILNILSLRR
ncbi:hypothetical protein M1N61_02445 [Peptococcaceae bacterium]|nr:hypothetical protein [Peptococcaceae bacterium]